MAITCNGLLNVMWCTGYLNWKGMRTIFHYSDPLQGYSITHQSKIHTHRKGWTWMSFLSIPFPGFPKWLPVYKQQQAYGTFNQTRVLNMVEYVHECNYISLWLPLCNYITGLSHLFFSIIFHFQSCFFYPMRACLCTHKNVLLKACLA